MRKSIIGSALLVALVSLAACSSPAPDTDTDTGTDLTPVTVGVIPIADTAPLYLGESLGFFEEAGIDLTIETAQGGAAIVPAVVAGEYQFGFSNLISLMLATDKGLPITLVSAGDASTGDTSSDFGAIIVKGDSPLETPADLNGKTVSSNTLNNIVDTTVRAVVDADGGDSSSVNFVEVAFPDAIAAVENSQVDAAFVVEPFVSAAVEAGLRVLSYGYAEFDPNMVVAGYFASTDLTESDPELVAAFQSAMKKSLEYAEAHPNEVRGIIATYTEIPEEVLANIVLPKFPSEIDAAAVQKLADAAFEYGLVTKEIDVDAFLP